MHHVLPVSYVVGYFPDFFMKIAAIWLSQVLVSLDIFLTLFAANINLKKNVGQILPPVSSISLWCPTTSCSIPAVPTPTQTESHETAPPNNWVSVVCEVSPQGIHIFGVGSGCFWAIPHKFRLSRFSVSASMQKLFLDQMFYSDHNRPHSTLLWKYIASRSSSPSRKNFLAIECICWCGRGVLYSWTMVPKWQQQKTPQRDICILYSPMVCLTSDFVLLWRNFSLVQLHWKSRILELVARARLSSRVTLISWNFKRE